MAEAEYHSERLKRLSERAAASRQALSQAGRHLQNSTDLGSRVRSSMQGHLATWVGSAAVIGWVLSRLPARKKKIYVNTGHAASVGPQTAAKSGLFVAIIGLVFKLVQPLLQKIVLEKIGHLAERHLGKSANQ
jgi:hypothetical protein